MSSILSASSSTRYVHRRKLVIPRSKKSINRPGVAITISTPRSRSRACGPFGAPPNTQVLRTYVEKPKSWATLCICWANSRVGARTKAMGPSPRVSLSWLLMWTIAGSIYANVLPEPVCAIPTISRPLIAMGHPCAWIEVGSLNPNFLISFIK